MMEPMPIPPELAVDEEPFDDETLDAYMDLERGVRYQEGDPVDHVAQWRVTDNGSAQWTMAKVAEIDDQLEQLALQAADWADRIQAWFDRASKPLLGRRRFFDAHLGRYAMERRQDDEKHNKTLLLPSGQVSTRRDPARVAIGQRDETVAWVRAAHPELLKYDVAVTDLRTVAKIVEVPTAVRLTLTCGCVQTVDWDGDPLPLVGDAVVCGACGDDALAGRVEVTAARLEVRDPLGDVVPGVLIEPAQLTYTVKPHKP